MAPQGGGCTTQPGASILKSHISMGILAGECDLLNRLKVKLLME